jgi:hypothetical protein
VEPAAQENADEPVRTKRTSSNRAEAEPENEEDDDTLWGSLGRVGEGAKRVKALVGDEPTEKLAKRGRKGEKAK